MELSMPVKIKEPESTTTDNEQHISESEGERRGEESAHRLPPKELRFDVVMSFEEGAARLTVIDVDIVAAGDRVQTAFSHLIEETRGHLASPDNPRAALLDYPPLTWFRFVDPDRLRLRPRRAEFWPEGEDVDDFIAAATEGRYEEEDEPDF